MLANGEEPLATGFGAGSPWHGAAHTLRLSDAVEEGLPLAAFDEIAGALAPGDASFAYRLIPKATLARRRKAQVSAQASKAKLSPEEGAKVARLAAVWEAAKDVWGSDEAARDFLFRPNMVLEMRRPVDVVLANEFGRPVVEGILGRLKYGIPV
jgi:putative toxin-antitoxin system antitoxin component (TIGR02293 family)